MQKEMLKRIIFTLILTSFVSISVFAQTSDESVKLWSRGDLCYLSQGYSMPIWPQFPHDSIGIRDDLVMTIEMPVGFSVTGFGQSDEFATQPTPLMMPKKVETSATGAKVKAVIDFPSMPVEAGSDNLQYAPDVKKVYRASLMVKADVEPGTYDISIALRSKSGETVWKTLNAKAIVLPALKNKRPDRIRVEAFNYNGYTSREYKEAMMDAVRGSGINVLTDMRLDAQDEDIPQKLRSEGIKADLILFWHNLIPAIGEKYPEAYPFGPDGVRVTKPDFMLKNNICHTWILDNKDIVKTVLVDYFKANVLGRYDGITNDNEEKAITREKTVARGDVYTPITIEAFKKRYNIDPAEKLTPESIAQKYADQWVDFRCWQSAEMAQLLGDAIAEVDPTLEYGYYSGHKYVGSLAGFTKNMYATDWDLLAQKGIHFGSSGYYGSIDDYAATTKALAASGVRHIPAEMYIENFLDFARAMPTYEQFRYRLMNSLMYGNGGFAIWYLQVMDAAAFYATSEVAAVSSEIEDFLLDGERVDDQLAIPPTMDKRAVFAYQLGQKRMVVVMNHSARTMNVRLAWKNPIRKPDTVEIVTGKNLGDSKMMTAILKPKDFAVFITLSEGN